MKYFYVLLCLSKAIAQSSFYPSGLPEYLDLSLENQVQSEDAAVNSFFGKHFQNLAPTSEWKALWVRKDGTHTHRRYQLFHQGRRVEGRSVDLHYDHRYQMLDLAVSNLESPLAAATQADLPSEEALAEVRKHQEAQMRRKYSGWRGRVEVEPVFWMDGNGQPIAAYFVRIVSSYPIDLREFFLEEGTGKVLEKRKSVRFGAQIWEVDPLDALAPYNRPAISDVTATYPATTDGAKLINGTCHVVYQGDTSAVTSVVEVTPNTDFTGAAGYVEPCLNDATYKPNCVGGGTCGNQEFEATNVYYHINAYRTRLNTYLSELGANPTFTQDPIKVIVNALSVDFDDDGSTTDESNNAAYLPIPCGSLSSINHCIVFLKPASINPSGVCNSGNGQLYSLAREAVVIVHEYQHYVTDKISGVLPGSSTSTVVGDALHEGYSDYFAASHVSDASSQTVDRVGEYAFLNCPPLIRDLSTVRVYQNSSSDSDPHVSGLSWASGLWYLRTQYGASTVDKLALKSLFFLSATPSFAEAIEALVRADQSLYAGAHVAEIRNLFYEKIRFVGGQKIVFRDATRRIVEVGFRSCSAEGTRRSPSDPKGALLFFGISLLLVRGLRWIRRAH